jgi:hypothetical protein
VSTARERSLNHTLHLPPASRGMSSEAIEAPVAKNAAQSWADRDPLRCSFEPIAILHVEGVVDERERGHPHDGWRARPTPFAPSAHLLVTVVNCAL